MIERRPRPIDDPQPGYFRVRLVRNGPWVSARIIHAPPNDPDTGEPLDRSYYWSAEINGALVAAPSPSPVHAGVLRIWLYGEPITDAEYRYLLGVKAHAERHDGEAPAANPRRSIDLNKLKPIF